MLQILTFSNKRCINLWNFGLCNTKKFSKENLKMEKSKWDTELELLNEYCMGLGMGGAETICFMWRDNRVAFREWLLKKGYEALGTEDGFQLLMEKCLVD